MWLTLIIVISCILRRVFFSSYLKCLMDLSIIFSCIALVCKLFLTNMYESIMILLGLIFVFTCIVQYFDKNAILMKAMVLILGNISFAVTIAMFVLILVHSGGFFEKITIMEFLFGKQWRPEIFVSGGEARLAFGVLPLLAGTFLIAIIALLFSFPFAILSAIYVNEYASRRIKNIINTMFEVLAGVPSVTYGYFAVMFLAPFMRNVADAIGIPLRAESALSAGIILGVMMYPYMSALIEDAIDNVPRTLKYASLALGATPSETMFYITLPTAKSAIISTLMLALSRVVGETMTVLMAAGISAHLTFNPLHSVTTMTVQIVTLLTGEQEFNSMPTHAAFVLVLSLFIITWTLNACSLWIMKRS